MSSTTATRAASIHRWCSAATAGKPACVHPWDLSVTPTTTPCARASSPHWNVSCWHAAGSHPGLGLRCEPAACQQLTFQCGEEALAHGVVVGVTDRSHGWAHAGFPAAAAERQRCILAALVAVV